MENFGTMTLYFIPSPYGLNWESPSKLAKGILKNKLLPGSRFMGHVNIELDYQDPEDGKVHILTGMTQKKMNAPKLLFKEKYGLGILYHSFEGRLESIEELTPELNKYFKRGNKKINFVKYKLNLSVCRRIRDYVAQYTKNGHDRYYGLYNKPLHGEGAGCSAFGASFLEVAGILEEEHHLHWSQKRKNTKKTCGWSQPEKSELY
jgi:hypothetical protein